MAWAVRAVLRAELKKNVSQRIVLNRVESYSVDSAMDTDTDSFRIEIGDPTADLIRLTERDNEVLVNIFGGEGGQLEEMQKGIADTVGFTEEGTLAISGRDLSSIATDSSAPPHDYNHYRPHVQIQKEARSLGFQEFNLSKVPAIGHFYTDGSETYWEKWYRAYRKRGRWMWLEPTGVLRADTLWYKHNPDYFFGTRPAGNKRHWIPVESVEITTRKQGRVGIAEVIGARKELAIFARVADKSIQSWVRRPFQVFQDGDVRSQKDARKAAFDEIFEAKVGALEIIITIPHPGRLIRQNRMARLRVPDAGINGEFFVVGVEVIGGTEGSVQKIRLREKGYALTRRIPDDPKLDRGPNANVAGDMALGVRWGDSFVQAAREFHGPWPFDLFCAGLLAICKKETGFRNVRYAGSTEWYPPPSTDTMGVHQNNNISAALQRHHRLFANSINNPLNPLHGRSEAAVGPMQLVTPTFKVWADEHGHRSGEYAGGRWKPPSNIWAAARALHAKLQGVPVSEANFFTTIGARYYGSNSDAANRAYAGAIKQYVMKSPGYLGIVREAQAKATDELNTNSSSKKAGPPGWGGSKAIADQFRAIGAKHGLTATGKRSTKNTSTGGVSDHWEGNLTAFAYDMSDRYSGVSPAKDATAKECVRKCGGSYNGKSELKATFHIDGYRIQILYRTYVGGNHFNHVHVGVKKE